MNVSFKMMSAVLAVMTTVLFVPDARAESSCPQASTEEQARQLASQMFDQAEALYRRQDCGALEKFQCSFSLFPHPNTLYNIGRTAERCDREELAIQTYQQFLERYPQDPERQEIERRLRNLEPSSPPDEPSQPPQGVQQTHSDPVEPPDQQVEPADQQVVPPEQNQQVHDQPPLENPFHIDGPQQTDITRRRTDPREQPPEDFPVDHPPSGDEPELGDDSENGAEKPEESNWQRIFGWSTLATGAVSTVTGGAFYLSAVFVNSDFQELQNNGNPTTNELVILRDRGRSYQIAGGVLLGIGGLALIVSTIVLVIQRIRSNEGGQSSSVFRNWDLALIKGASG